jgi:hypothetical protein
MEKTPKIRAQAGPPSILSLAARPDVVRRSLGYAVVVGAILIAINHGDAFLAGEISSGRALKMLLTVCVPYCVSTASSVGAIRSQRAGTDSGTPIHGGA